MHTEVPAGFRDDEFCRCAIVCTEADAARRRSSESVHVARARKLYTAERIAGNAGAIRSDPKSYGEPGGAGGKRQPDGGTIRSGIDPGKPAEGRNVDAERKAAR